MNNKLPLVLTIDFGTQSLRTALINNKGEIEAIVKRKYEPAYISTDKGYAEQDPDFYYDNLVICLKELAKDNKEAIKAFLSIFGINDVEENTFFTF